MYVTLFGYTTARRAFPCWDDVRNEATFNISIVHPARQTALSTVPAMYTQFIAMNTTDNAAKPMAVTVFTTTPKILTHQVMIAIMEVHECDNYTEVLSNGTQIRVWGRRKKKDKLIAVRGTAQKIMDFLSKKMGFSWKRPRLNFVLFPKLPVEIAGIWGLAVVR